jgi:hypothetical protein
MCLCTPKIRTPFCGRPGCTPQRDSEADYMRLLQMAEPVSAMKREILLLRGMVDALINHCDKESGECSVCSFIVCPHKDLFHFHHDGCPACSTECERPVPGWVCTRESGHDGPCAAIPAAFKQTIS